jgi:hypothetical protein
MSKKYFPEKSIPKVYAYTDTRFPNCIKVGYTTKTAQERVAEQLRCSHFINNKPS